MTPTKQYFILSVLFLVFIGISGCNSTSRESSNETRISLQAMDSDIQSAIRQLGNTGSSLDDLMSVAQNDLNKVFDTDYFEGRQKEGTEYKNPRIHQLSDQRRAALGKIYNKIAENSIGVDEAFKTYVSDVKEIRTFLSNDLTTKGIAAIDPTSEKVVSDGDSLKYAIQKLQTAIQDVRAEMTHSGTN